MKKQAYIILTTIITLSTTCMEREHPNAVALNIQTEPSIALQSNSPLLQFNTLDGLLQPQPLPVHIIRKQHSDIGFDFVPVYVQTNTNEASSTNDIELMPIYRPIEGSTTECFDCINKKNVSSSLTKKKQSFLINELYEAASHYLRYYKENNYNLKKHQQLTHIITLMYEAKKHNIHEDFMIPYAYKKSPNTPYCRAFTPLLFNCLKKYTATTSITNETVPFNGMFFDAKEIRNLKLTCKPITKEDIDQIAQTYPLYSSLIHTCAQQLINDRFDELIDCLYINKQTLFNGYQQQIITDFDDFYFQANQLLCDINGPKNKKSRNDIIYDIINLVECIKNKENISCQNMCNKILQSNPTQTFAIWWKYGYVSYTHSPYRKYNIAMLYMLTEEYNQARKNRKTPTGKQYTVYNQKKVYGIDLPENFDATLFDKKFYAFNPFQALKHGIETFTKANGFDLQKMVELKIKQLTTKANSST